MSYLHPRIKDIYLQLLCLGILVSFFSMAYGLHCQLDRVREKVDKILKISKTLEEDIDEHRSP